MSKYEPLRRHLADRRSSEFPMKFDEVEALLGFSLPPSARRHAAWWSNNVGTNVAVKAWRDAGWKTSRVDVGGEKLVFIREQPVHSLPDEASASNIGVSEPFIQIEWSELSVDARRLLEDIVEANGATRKAAVLEVVNAAVRERRRRLVDDFRARSTGMTSDSVDLIREDRYGR